MTKPTTFLTESLDVIILIDYDTDAYDAYGRILGFAIIRCPLITPSG